MNQRVCALAALIAAGTGSVALGQSSVVFPNAWASTPTTTGVNGIFNWRGSSSSPREYTYQMVVDAQELAGIPAGSLITGLNWRLIADPLQTTWPTSKVRIENFDVYLSTAARTPSTMSTWFDVNEGPDRVMARGGSLVIPAGAFPGGAAIPRVNEWGFDLGLNTAFRYQGGGLCITIRQTGHTGTGPDSIDRFLESARADMPGWGTRFAAMSGPGYAASQGTWRYIAITNVQYTTPCLGDFNLDGTVDFNDYMEFLNLYNTNDLRADLTGDGVVDFNDYLALLNQVNTGC